MTKGLQLLSQIASLARKAEKELAHPEDVQVAVEIKLAAELVINSHGARGLSPHRPDPHHD